MKRIIGIALALAIILPFAGCASVSREDCLVTDWYETGRLDGMNGLARTTFQNRAKPCLKYGVAVDRPAYYQGHDEGLTHYCTPQKGYELGVQGLTYNPICPTGPANDFMAGYQEGLQSYCIPANGFELGHQGRAYRYICPTQSEAGFRAAYNQGKALYDYEREVARLQGELERLEHKISKREKDLLSEKLGDKERAEIRTELKKMDGEYRETARELKLLEASPPVVQIY